MTRRLFMILWLFCLLPNVNAQNTNPPMPVIFENDIFGEDVIIMERLATLYYNEQKIYYYDVGTLSWHTYDLPTELYGIQYVEQRSNGDILLSTVPPLTFADTHQSLLLYDNTLGFNPVDGNFYLPELACGYVQQLPTEGRWVVSNSFEDENYRLCHTETGEISAPFPDGLQNISATYCTFPERANVFSSTVFSYVVVVNCPSLQMSGTDYSIYTYDITTQQFNTVGNISPANVANALQRVIFLNESEFAVLMGDIESELYKADATQEDSIFLIARMSGSFPRSYSQPPRLAFFDYEDGYLKIINLVTEDISSLLNYQIENDGRVPRDVRVHSLSPDGRYLVYGFYANFVFNSFIVDLDTGAPIYSRFYNSYELDQVLWLSSTTLILYMANLSNNLGVESWDVFQVDIADTVEIEQITTIDTDFPNATDRLPSADNRFITIVRTNKEFHLYDTFGQREIEILSLPEGVSGFQVRWIDNDIMWVKVGINQWHIKINPVNGIQP